MTRVKTGRHATTSHRQDSPADFGGKWETRRLGDLVDIDPENLPANTDPDYEFNYISLEQVETGRLLGCTVEIFRTSPSRARRRLRRNDVLMSTVRPNLMGHLLFDFNNEQFTNAVCSTGFAVLRCKRNLSVPGFLFAHLFGPVVNKWIERVLAGSNYPAISSQDVAPIEIPCPSIREQTAIAAVLSDVDRLIESLELLIAKKRAVKTAAMQQLLTGKTRLPGFSDEWKTKRIGDFTDCTAGGTPSTHISEYWGGAIQWMSSGELNDKIIRDVEGRITNRGLRESSTKIVPPKCVLVGLAGQGKTRGTVAFSTIELCVNQSIAAIYPNESFFPEYLYHNLDARYDEMRGMSTGDSGRGGLNLQIIRAIELPFPTIDEQRAIAAILSDMDAEIAVLEQRHKKTRAIKQSMMQQLLTGKIRLAESVETGDEGPTT